MQHLISLREVNQHLSQYINIVEKGNEVIITRRGKPIAKMVPLGSTSTLTPQQEKGRKRLQALMKQGLSLKGESFKREQLHER